MSTATGITRAGLRPRLKPLPKVGPETLSAVGAMLAPLRGLADRLAPQP
jgi:hypothetical protein